MARLTPHPTAGSTNQSRIETNAREEDVGDVPRLIETVKRHWAVIAATLDIVLLRYDQDNTEDRRNVGLGGEPAAAIGSVAEHDTAISAGTIPHGAGEASGVEAAAADVENEASAINSDAASATHDSDAVAAAGRGLRSHVKTNQDIAESVRKQEEWEAEAKRIKRAR